MGDRTYLSATIHGPINEIEVLENLIIVLENESLASVDYSLEREQALETFAEVLDTESNPFFYNTECNYASVNEFETFCQENKIAYTLNWEAGSDYPAGNKSYYPDLGVFDLNMVDMSTDRLHKAIKDGTIKKLLDDIDLADGVKQPKFTVSDTVREYIKTKIAEKIAPPDPSRFTVEIWRIQVASGDTLLGFEQWKELKAKG